MTTSTDVQTIYTGLGAVDFVEVTVATDINLTGLTVQLAVGTYTAPGMAWIAPDAGLTLSSDFMTAFARLWIGNGHTNPIAGRYYLWYRIVNGTQVVIKPVRGTTFETTDPTGFILNEVPPWVAAVAVGAGLVIDNSDPTHPVLTGAPVLPQPRTSADPTASYTLGGSFPTGTNTVINSRRRKRTHTAGTDVMLEFQAITGIGEATAPNGDGSAWTIRASLEYPAGTFHPAYSEGGNRDITVVPGGPTIGRLYVPGFDIPADTDYWVRTRVTVPATGALLAMGGGDGVTEWGVIGTGAADYTLTNSGAPSVNVSQTYNPAAIIYRPFTPLPCVGAVGDSILASKGDPDGGAADNTSGPGGYFARALSLDGSGRGAPNIPNVNMSISQETASNWSDPAKRRARLQVLRDAGCANFYVNLLTNDLGAPLATLQARVLAIWTTLAHTGRVFAGTLGPVAVTSTDGYATVGNQTPGANETIRVQLNQWLRAGAPINPTTKVAVAVGTIGALLAGTAGHPLFAVSDIGGVWESTQDSGRWKVGYNLVGDGTHPSQTAHIAAAARLALDMIPNLIIGVGHVQALTATT